jgi:HPt (histidine-containing phosphotransfer) domain-containing protein
MTIEQTKDWGWKHVVRPDDLQKLRGTLDQNILRPEDLIKKLSAAIQSGAAKEVTELAHEDVGATASCGMTAIVPALQELERLGRSGFLSGAEQSLAAASGQVSRIKYFLTNYLPSY